MSSVASSWISPNGPIRPFWQRIPKFFQFPSYPAPLIRNLILSLLMGIAVWTESLFFVLPMFFAITVELARYGFLVIERASQGFLNPADYPATFEQQGLWRPYKIFAVFFLAIGAEFFAGAVHNVFFTFIVNAGIALAIPASAMVLTITDNLVAAIDPTRLWDLARKIGKPYFAMVLFLLLLMLGTRTAYVVVTPAFQSSRWVLAAATTFISNYFFLIMCALVGYVMYQYHELLGLSVVGDGDRDRPSIKSIDTAARTRDALIGQMVTAGEVKEAIELLSRDLSERPADLSLHSRLHRLLTVADDSIRIDDHAERYLDLLMKTQNYPEALELVQESQARHPGYQPRDASHNAPLARAALQASNPTMAAALIKGFDKKNPLHVDVAIVYFIGARIMAEAGRNDQQAQRILEHLIAKYPADAVIPEAQKYLDVLRRVPHTRG